MELTVYNVWELDSKGRPNRDKGKFVAERGNPPVVSLSHILVEEMYEDDIVFWLELVGFERS